MFNTYISKHGITVIGQRPMFEDSEHETLGRDIKAKFLEVFGCYPILDISEKWETWDEDEQEAYVHRDYHVMIDTEFLHHDCYGISYVQFLFEKVLTAGIADPTLTELSTYASKKYCFSDTEDWWDLLKVIGDSLPGDRRVITLSVELG